MSKRRKPAQSPAASRAGRDRPGKLVQARIDTASYKDLAALAENDTRSIANYIEHVLYEHIRIAKAALSPQPVSE